jgi:hypothetical protein
MLACASAGELHQCTIINNNDYYSAGFEVLTAVDYENSYLLVCNTMTSSHLLLTGCFLSALFDPDDGGDKFL